ncbi:hypothetical protein D3C87_1731500 [compost metagenome]
MGILPGQWQRIDAFEEATCTFGIISRGGDFGITHTVANQQNNIFSGFLIQRRTQRFGLISSQTACATRLRDIALCNTIIQHAGIRGVRMNDRGK